jgi:hypothetical protein
MERPKRPKGDGGKTLGKWEGEEEGRRGEECAGMGVELNGNTQEPWTGRHGKSHGREEGGDWHFTAKKFGKGAEGRGREGATHREKWRRTAKPWTTGVEWD